MRYKAKAELLIYQLMFVVKRNAVIRALFICEYLYNGPSVPSKITSTFKWHKVLSAKCHQQRSPSH
ncbi:hypothetical protein T4D_6176 [Trichinella pseudospiralis]|uniref:Uncharacterized protein n=1 Tax=Trichinella pseudospiralis TaxID=6337 RepID=A0A0V1FJA6_TRIPS|nr:hypothetical protein T4D_6176 [Trichinella pseudospiralis]